MPQTPKAGEGAAREGMFVMFRFTRFLLVLFWIIGSLAWNADAVIHPGFTSVPSELVDPGELLLGELNCLACHAAEAAVQKRLVSRQGPVLGLEGLQVTLQYLRLFLSDPQSTKPGTTMPDLLHGVADKAESVDALVHFLISVNGGGVTVPPAADEFKIQQGRMLYHQAGCVACHAPQEPASILAVRNPEVATTAPNPAHLQTLVEQSVPLGDLARKMTVETLARFLKDPLKVRPSGQMPSLNLTDAEATAIAMYLLRAQIITSPNGVRPRSQGLAYQYYEGNFNQTADLEKQKPKSSGLMPKFGVGDRANKQFFGLRLSGFITVPRDGSYTFYTDSDDGSRLFVGDKMVVENDNIHGPTERQGSIDLKAGEHPILVTFFNGGAGASLKVSWKGPGIGKREVPAEALFTYGGQPMIPVADERLRVDPAKAARGKQLFASLGCAACHAGIGTLAASKQKAFADLAGSGGCLGDVPPVSAPKYAFSKDQRDALVRVLARRTGLAQPLDPVHQVNRTMAAMNCFACHNRAGVGGPSPERAEYFTVVGGADMGDEGRIPPHLTAVGSKLRPEWTREVLINKGYVRPYMATRMPQFGEPNVGNLAAALEQADASAVPAPVAATPTDVKFGRNLVGTGGFSCISCHTFGSHKSLGIPAVDLTLTTRRLKAEWFHRYLLDPQSLRPGTRMPGFWPDGKSSRQDILGGNTDRQINAIWVYLSRTTEGGLPPGLVQGKLELVATSEPLIYRHFVQGAGSRAIAVGYPEKANLAFDANDLRLALLWQGSFIDAAKHRTGRGDGFVPPLGYNVVRLPSGPPFARLQSPNQDWPQLSGRQAGYQLRGYDLDARRRPTFRYSFQNAEIEDAPIPVPGEIDPFFQRTILVKADQAMDDLWFRAWVGTKVEEQGGGAFLADDKIKFRFQVAPGARPLVRRLGNKTELLVPVKFSGKEARLVEEITW